MRWTGFGGTGLEGVASSRRLRFGAEEDIGDGDAGHSSGGAGTREGPRGPEMKVWVTGEAGKGNSVGPSIRRPWWISDEPLPSSDQPVGFGVSQRTGVDVLGRMRGEGSRVLDGREESTWIAGTDVVELLAELYSSVVGLEERRDWESESDIEPDPDRSLSGPSSSDVRTGRLVDGGDGSSSTPRP